MTTYYLIDTQENTIVNACDVDSGPKPTPPPWTPAPRFKYEQFPSLSLLANYEFWNKRP